MKKKIYIPLLLIAFVCGGVVGATAFSDCDDDYTFINPRFACKEGVVISKGEYRELRSRLAVALEDAEREGRAKYVSVYFRDLESGPTMGINEQKNFLPASLLKLPVAIAVYELENSFQNVLTEKVAFTTEIPAHAQNQHFPPPEKLERDTPYTLEELIFRMLVYSDNIAFSLLNTFTKQFPGGTESSFQTFKELGIVGVDMKTGEIEGTITVKGYASLFRQLYNASYLSSAHSEDLLRTLAQNTFKEGLRQGVPEGVAISHKFGERFFDSGEKQLHDCGIVYYPDNPYLLCVMTVGDDFEELSGVIGMISKEVYEEVDSRKI